MANVPPDASSTRSYRALFAVPHLPQVVASLLLARTAQGMVGVALVLFTLAEYDSPALAGLATFAFIFPGILISPIAGALLDRHGRVRLIILDYLVAAVTMLLIGGLSLADQLPAWLLIVLALVSSLTAPFSQTGLRSLFPLMVPEHLWERANALDSNGYLVATILAPPFAAALVAVAGPQVAILAISIPYLLGALALLRVSEPSHRVETTGRLMLDAWQGLVYTWRNRTLRGLGFSVSTLNLGGGMATIVVPLIVVERLGGSEALVGLVFALSGVAGMASVLLFGRMDSRGREWALLVIPMAFFAPAILLMLPVIGPLAAMPVAALGLLTVAIAIVGLLNGPMDIGLFTIRQRRTDPAWLGRAFAISMAFNFLGYPIGAALAGALADVSLEAAILMGVVASVLATVFAAVLVPRRDDAGYPVRAGEAVGASVASGAGSVSGSG
jgi:MFS family permease